MLPAAWVVLADPEGNEFCPLPAAPAGQAREAGAEDDERHVPPAAS